MTNTEPTSGMLNGTGRPWRGAALVLSLALAWLPTAAAGAVVEDGSWTGAIGDPAPALELTTLEGDEVSLRELEGSAVLVNLWATYCLPCRHEMPILDDLASGLRDEGLVLLGVSLDDPSMEDRVRELQEELGLEYPLLLDPRGEASGLFEAPALPASYLFDRKGTLVWKRVGVIVEGDPDLERALEKALEAPEAPAGSAAPAGG